MSTPEPRIHSLAVPYVGFPAESHRVQWLEWGDAANPRVALCVHGLTRNARDFDYLARALAADFRVIAVDMPGRGGSEWLAHKEEYTYPHYLANLAALLAYLQLTRVQWVGTSMGGILGMLAAAHQPQLVEKLVINDIGAFVPAEAIARIRTYVGKLVNFPSRAAAEAMLRQTYAPFGVTREEHWQHLFEHSMEPLPDGSVRLRYDPAIGEALNATPEPQAVDLWETWRQVKCPVLLIRGAQSDLLQAEVAREMVLMHPGTKRVEIEGAGHAPALMEDAQTRMVREWLNQET